MDNLNSLSAPTPKLPQSIPSSSLPALTLPLQSTPRSEFIAQATTVDKQPVFQIPISPMIERNAAAQQSPEQMRSRAISGISTTDDIEGGEAHKNQREESKDDSKEKTDANSSGRWTTEEQKRFLDGIYSLHKI